MDQLNWKSQHKIHLNRGLKEKSAAEPLPPIISILLCSKRLSLTTQILFIPPITPYPYCMIFPYGTYHYFKLCVFFKTCFLSVPHQSLKTLSAVNLYIASQVWHILNIKYLLNEWENHKQNTQEFLSLKYSLSGHCNDI